MFRPHLHRISLSPDEQISAERLRRDVDMLAGVIGPRHVGRYDMLMAAERYVRMQLEQIGGRLEEQAYPCDGRTVRNVSLEWPGASRPEQIVIVGAHYDSIHSTPGADDNASAVAGMLEIARQLTGRRFARTLRFVAFVNEEPPYYKSDEMGSVRYARLCQALGDRIVGMINLEMIGYYDDAPASQEYPGLGWWARLLPTRGNFITICGNLQSANLLRKVAWSFWRSVRFPMLPFLSPRGESGTNMSDNWSFWECGYPALMITDTSFLRNPHYHKPGDLPKTLHFPAMTRVVKGLAGAVARLGGKVR